MRIEVVQHPEHETGFSPVVSERLKLKNILVPTDFSLSSVKALSYGIAMSRQFDAMLSLLHVVEPTPAFSGLESLPILTEEPDQMAKGEHLIAEFAAKYVPSDVAVTSLVRSGSAVREISDFAKSHEIDLVIASTHEHSRMGRILFGGITERIIHNAPCPILIVREVEHDFVHDGAPRIQINRVLAPVDFSPCSRKALRYATAFASQFNAEILCLHVMEPEKPLIVIETEGFRKKHKIEAEGKMTELMRQIDPSIHAESIMVDGAPHREIIGLADRKDVDLIIVGEHCRTGVLGRFMLGSTADEVVRHAHCPVLVIRPEEHEFLV